MAGWDGLDSVGVLSWQFMVSLFWDNWCVLYVGLLDGLRSGVAGMITSDDWDHCTSKQWDNI